MVTNSRTPIRTDRLRPLNVPRSVQVTLGNEIDNDQPIAVQIGSRNFVIEVIREYWEIDDEWWRNRIARRYYDVVLKGGKHAVMFENVLQHTWFIQDP